MVLPLAPGHDLKISLISCSVELQWLASNQRISTTYRAFKISTSTKWLNLGVRVYVKAVFLNSSGPSRELALD